MIFICLVFKSVVFHQIVLARKSHYFSKKENDGVTRTLIIWRIIDLLEKNAFDFSSNINKGKGDESLNQIIFENHRAKESLHDKNYKEEEFNDKNKLYQDLRLYIPSTRWYTIRLFY